MTRIVDRRTVRSSHACSRSCAPASHAHGARARSQADDGAVEYRLREGPRNPLSETPDTDVWKPAAQCDPATVAEAETWLGKPQAQFERRAGLQGEEGSRRTRRPESKREKQNRSLARADRASQPASPHVRAPRVRSA